MRRLFTHSIASSSGLRTNSVAKSSSILNNKRFPTCIVGCPSTNPGWIGKAFKSGTDESDKTCFKRCAIVLAWWTLGNSAIKRSLSQTWKRSGFLVWGAAKARLAINCEYRHKPRFTRFPSPACFSPSKSDEWVLTTLTKAAKFVWESLRWPQGSKFCIIGKSCWGKLAIDASWWDVVCSGANRDEEVVTGTILSFCSELGRQNLFSDPLMPTGGWTKVWLGWERNWKLPVLSWKAGLGNVATEAWEDQISLERDMGKRGGCISRGLLTTDKNFVGKALTR